MKNIRIDYYTGTGGSKVTAELLSESLQTDSINVELNRIFRADIDGEKELRADYYVLVFPVHAFNAPKTIYEWVGHLTGNNCKTAVISVSGGGDVISNTACRNKTVKLLKERNFNVIFEEMVRMPNNWVKAPGKEKCARILSELPGKISAISQAVISEKTQSKTIYRIDYLISALGEAINKKTYKFGKGMKVLDSCDGCGICADNCCSSNIEIENKAATDSNPKPKFGNRCDMCLGCVYGCPQKALKPTWGAYQIDKNGYNLTRIRH